MKLFDLTGKYAIVIGGGGGIGHSMAQGLAQAGARVGIASRNLDNLKAVADAFKKESGLTLDVFQVDASDEESINKLAQDVKKAYGRIDILVNSQGFNVKYPALEFDMKEWDRLFAVNVKGVMMACKAFGAIMAEQKYGKIINVSSVRGIRANAGGNSAYCASKAAVDMITRCLAAEWAKLGINVNAVCPALIATPMMEKVMAEPGRAEQYTRNIPLGRLAKTEETVGTCLFLASPASDYVTGQMVYCDGGLTAIG
jgi:NAD(P)-dependent dehydrogenase (short-subunit alcohol dehydrogenase family)